MAQLENRIELRRRWFFKPAMAAALIALRLGIVQPKRSAEWAEGFEPADHRVARWIVDRCMVLTVA